jgi:glycine hydroxymethyltransferase
LKNIKTANEYLQSRGFTIVSNGTDNHLFVADMRSKGVDGGRIEAVMNEISISINKNTVPGDKSALIPSGIRIGSPAMTTRGCKEADFLEIMKFIERATDITNTINKKAKGTKLKDFKDALQADLQNSDLLQLRKEVNAFSDQFPVPGGLI